MECDLWFLFQVHLNHGDIYNVTNLAPGLNCLIVFILFLSFYMSRTTELDPTKKKTLFNLNNGALNCKIKS